MLLLMMELKGRFNGKMIKKAKFGDIYFDEMGGFESVEKDRLTGKVSPIFHVLALDIDIETPLQDVVRNIHVSKPTRDLRTRLMSPTSSKMSDEDNKLIISFIDLLDKCLALDPSRRIAPREALAHPFIRG
jgi:serine/threonine-protein kinase PRP4